MADWRSDWSREERRAYAKGIEKGKELASTTITLRDRFAIAALSAGITNPSRAYGIADAMMEIRNQEDDEIPF